jgi:hypothetical protein
VQPAQQKEGTCHQSNKVGQEHTAADLLLRGTAAADLLHAAGRAGQRTAAGKAGQDKAGQVVQVAGKAGRGPGTAGQDTGLV